MSIRSKSVLLSAGLLLSFVLLVPLAKGDSLSIVYTSSPDQTALIGTGFTAVLFSGYVVNNTNEPITFQLTGGPIPFEPYVASFIDGIGYPGITLPASESTSIIDLATINLNPFDPSLTYPGVVNIVLQAISVDPATGRTGPTITENDASIRVQTAVPEPSSFVLLALALLAGCIVTRFKVRV